MAEVKYVVLETRFLDDYKSRGDDWSTSKVYVFSTVEKAEEFVRVKEHLYCKTALSESEDSTLEEYKTSGYLDDEGNVYKDRLDDLFEELTKGEFVPSTYVLELDEQVVDIQCALLEHPPFAQHKRPRHQEEEEEED